MYAKTRERQHNDMEEAAGRPHTCFVYLDSGEVVAVEGVLGLHVTDTTIEFEREAADPVVFARDLVFFAGCEAEMPPFAG